MRVANLRLLALVCALALTACSDRPITPSSEIPLSALDSILATTPTEGLTVADIAGLTTAQALLHKGIRPPSDTMTVREVGRWATEQERRLQIADSVTRATEKAQADSATRANAILPYTRYARAIKIHGDSTMRASSAFRDVSADQAVRSILRGDEVTRKAGDFEAVRPPPELQTVHEQMAVALRSLARTYRREAAALQKVEGDCAVASALDRPCDKGIRQATILLQTPWRGPFDEYFNARRRAQELLRQHGVHLADYSR